MLREIRKVKDRKKSKYIRALVDRGSIAKYSKNGYCAYDTLEYNTYVATRKIGRPIGSTKYNLNKGEE